MALMVKRITNHISASEAKTAIWRPGRKVGRTIYAQLFPTPSDNDILLGMVDFPDLAEHICDLHNKFILENGIKQPSYFIKSKNKLQHMCKRCHKEESETWWKCCPRHCSERGPDVVCDTCK